MKCFHVTTPKKLERYRASGMILAPVRYWPGRATAEAWGRKTGRSVLCIFDEPLEHHPLPDHRPARFTPDNVREFVIETISAIAITRK